MDAEWIGRRICDELGDFLSSDNPRNSEWERIKESQLAFIKSLDPDEAFFGLIWICENQDRYQYQCRAGELLRLADLPCPITLEMVIFAVLPRFNFSASPVIMYMNDSFGKNAIIAELKRLKKTTLDPSVISKLECIAYWLNDPDALKFE